MTRLTAIIAVIILYTASAFGNIIVANLSDSDNNPIENAVLYVECRDNYFFTDKNGRAMIYVEDSYMDCVVGISHSEFMPRDLIVGIDTDSDTTFCDLKLYRPNEPEPINPADPYSRFGRIETCGNGCITAEPIELHGETSLVFILSPDCGQSAGYLTLREDESLLCGEPNGYNLERARYVVFEARVVNGDPDITFISLWNGCDSKPGTYPEHKANLSNNFTEYRMNLSMWKLSNVRTIWGFESNGTDHAQPSTIEIKDIRIIFGEDGKIADSE